MLQPVIFPEPWEKLGTGKEGVTLPIHKYVTQGKSNKHLFKNLSALPFINLTQHLPIYRVKKEYMPVSKNKNKNKK